MTVYGYARVSTEHQGIQLLINELKQEKVSGKNIDDRHELQRLIDTATAGDKIVFTKLDRFARSTVDALTVAKQIHEKGVIMVVLNFAGMQVDVSTPTGS